jgi:hypothetical protein
MEQDVELRVEALKVTQEWSKWLISLEGVVCVSLWSKLTAPLTDATLPPRWLFGGWIMFWASIISAAILLISISGFVRRADVNSESDARRLRRFVTLEYAFFFAGLLCFALRIADQIRLGKWGNFL